MKSYLSSTPPSVASREKEFYIPDPRSTPTGTEDNTIIIYVDTEHPEHNLDFEVLLVPRVTHNRYDFKVFDTHHHIDLEDMREWKACVAFDNFPRAHHYCTIMVTGPSITAFSRLKSFMPDSGVLDNGIFGNCLSHTTEEIKANFKYMRKDKPTNTTNTPTFYHTGHYVYLQIALHGGKQVETVNVDITFDAYD
eukprot:12183587-Ditylum_brightwellii.AAC.1